MVRPSPFVVLTLALAISALMTAPRAAHAQEAPVTPLRLSITKTASTTADDAAFLVAGLAPTNAHAGQQPSGGGSRHGGVGVGVKGGFLYTSFSAANANYKNDSGWIAGLFFGGNRPGVLGLMGEVMYAKKSAKSGAVPVDLYYLEIPILLRLNAGTNSLNGVNFYGIAGPAFDIRLQAKVDGINFKDNYESLDIGAIAGGGIEITRFLIEARYNWGLRNVLKASGGGVTEIKTRSFAAMVGIRFN
jgi:hypothetical protein